MYNSKERINKGNCEYILHLQSQTLLKHQQLISNHCHAEFLQKHLQNLHIFRNLLNLHEEHIHPHRQYYIHPNHFVKLIK